MINNLNNIKDLLTYSPRDSIKIQSITELKYNSQIEYLHMIKVTRPSIMYALQNNEYAITVGSNKLNLTIQQMHEFADKTIINQYINLFDIIKNDNELYYIILKSTEDNLIIIRFELTANDDIKLVSNINSILEI